RGGRPAAKCRADDDAGCGARDVARLRRGPGPRAGADRCFSRRIEGVSRYDLAIVGAGMAGAGLAAALAGAARVLLLEAEDRPGYHSTGRSAAFWSESYGGPLVQPLTSASHDALLPWLRPRGCIHLADAAGEEA